MHRRDVGAGGHGARSAGGGRLRRRGATEGRDVSVGGVSSPRQGVVPLVVNQLHAGGVATDDLLGLRVQGLETDLLVQKTLPSRTTVDGDVAAVDRSPVNDRQIICQARALCLELERQRETIHQAKLDVVTTCQPATPRVALLRGVAEGRLELRVYRWRALAVVVAGTNAILAWPATATQGTIVPTLVAPHLRPITRSNLRSARLEVVVAVRLDPEVLRIALQCPAVALVGDPDGVGGATVADP
mmetsp:Transcript_84869/g.216167  ORF Transcript_84869/g.216167 Transcript_84869/m.216167 type:complete len:244 (-) Transcript_84869:95-826(-)